MTIFQNMKVLIKKILDKGRNRRTGTNCCSLKISIHVVLLSYKWHLCLNLKKPFHHSLPPKILFFYNFNTIPLVAACWCFYPNEILYTAKQYKLKPVDKTTLFSSASRSRHQGGDAVKRNKQHLCQPNLWFKVPTWLISHTLSVKPFLSLALCKTDDAPTPHIHQLFSCNQHLIDILSTVFALWGCSVRQVIGEITLNI